MNKATNPHVRMAEEDHSSASRMYLTNEIMSMGGVTSLQSA